MVETEQAIAKKPPARRVLSDAFEIEQDGVIYHPHAEEWVEFRGGEAQRVGDWFDAVLMREQMESDGRGSVEGARMVADSLEGQLHTLERDILAWSWTDDRGEPYPSPPDAATLRLLGFSELMWLNSRGAIATVEDRKRQAEGVNVTAEVAEKNDSGGSSGSTEASTGNRAQRRRRNGS